MEVQWLSDQDLKRLRHQVWDSNARRCNFFADFRMQGLSEVEYRRYINVHRSMCYRENYIVESLYVNVFIILFFVVGTLIINKQIYTLYNDVVDFTSVKEENKA